jgi:hypothetical protein
LIGDIEVAFPRSAKGGVVAGVACTCAFATVYSQSVCGVFDPGGAYYTKFVAEQPHGPHHDRPVHPSGSYMTTVWATSASSTVTFGSGTIPDHPTLNWVVKGG